MAFYDKGGNFQGVFFEKEGAGSVLPAIKSLSDAPDGVVIAYKGQENATVFELVNENGTTELKDAMIAMQSYSQAYSPTELELLAADFDDDGVISLKDAMIIMQIYSQAVDPANLW